MDNKSLIYSIITINILSLLPEAKLKMEIKSNYRKIVPLTILLIILTCSNQLFSQTHSSKQIPVVLHHEIDGFVGSTHVPNGAYQDSDATLVVPNIGLNYKYWFDDRFAIGWYNNIVALTYVINSDTNRETEREYPITSTVVGVFRPWKGLQLFAGPGLEFDKNKAYFVARFGVDYAISLSNDWYLTPRFIFDNLGAEIQAFTLGLSVGRKF